MKILESLYVLVYIIVTFFYFFFFFSCSGPPRYLHSFPTRRSSDLGQPIAINQGVNFLVADMAAEIEAARLLTWQAAWLIDQGERATLQSSYAKRFTADTAMKVTTDAVQIFGGYGYMKEYPVEKLMRDAKLFQIYEGTSQIQ